MSLALKPRRGRSQSFCRGFTMARFFKVLTIMLLILGVIGFGGYSYLIWGMDEVLGSQIGGIDIQGLPDGAYEGSYKNSRWSNTVEVSISGGRIEGIKVVDDVTFKLEEPRTQLIDRVLEQQRIDVDAVSGATATSKAYLLAVEDALSSARF